MRTVKISEYINFGLILRHLMGVKPGWTFLGERKVENHIKWFFQYLKFLNLTVTLRASEELQKFYDELVSKADEKYNLNKEEAERLAKIVSTIRPTLEAEAQGNIAFIATDKRVDVNKLLYSIDTLMAPGIYASLPESAKYDFAECGKCIAFERPTAAAFHILRGTEAVLRMFYCALVKKNRMSTLLWGPIVVSLKKRRVPPPIELLDNLDNIRRSFRNPTQHPEKIYDIQEVQDLFWLCIDVINRMITYLETKGLMQIDAT
ncbi:MAG TPA: hypothetical protein VF131_19255 [Blastocatellia bacterium]|nr:hypothetical protein [Blastocatellia bacterium]